MLNFKFTIYKPFLALKYPEFPFLVSLFLNISLIQISVILRLFFQEFLLLYVYFFHLLFKIILILYIHFSKEVLLIFSSSLACATSLLICSFLILLFFIFNFLTFPFLYFSGPAFINLGHKHYHGIFFYFSFLANVLHFSSFPALA